jgi:hypothetical protein
MAASVASRLRIADARDQHTAQAVHLIQLAAQVRPHGLVGDQHGGFRIAGQIHHFFGGEQGGGGHRHGAALHAAQEGGGIVEAVGQADQDMLVDPDADVAQELGEAGGAQGQLPVGDCASAAFVVLDDHRQAVRDGCVQVGVGAGDADVEILGDGPGPGGQWHDGLGE